MHYHLMQIASKQLLPNLLAWHSLHKADLVSGMTLLYSDFKDSVAVADQTRLFVDTLADRSRGEPHWLWQEVEPSAQSVYLTAKECIEEDPDTRWILNATGGNKPMSIGLHLLAGHPQVHSVIYREHLTGWHHFHIAKDGVPEDLPIPPHHALYAPLVKDGTTLAEFPLPDLIHAQFGTLAQVRIETSSIPDVNVEHWLSRALRNNAGWSAALQALGGERVSDGTAFEMFVAACLRQAGVAQVACGIEAIDLVSNSKLQETDVIAFHGDKMVFIDCKLSNESAKTEQIRKACETAQKYGGLSATAIMVRPFWPVSATTEVYARANSTPLVNAGNRGDLINQLLRALGVALPLPPKNNTERAAALLRPLSAQTWDRVLSHKSPAYRK